MWFEKILAALLKSTIWLSNVIELLHFYDIGGYNHSFKTSMVLYSFESSVKRKVEQVIVQWSLESGPFSYCQLHLKRSLISKILLVRNDDEKQKQNSRMQGSEI